MAWFDEAELIMAQTVCKVFGLDPASDEASDFVRLAYHETTTTMQAGNQKNVCYVSLSAAPDVGVPTAQTVYGDNGAEIRQTVPLTCLFTFYGPDADVNANRFRACVMFDGGYDTPREFMRRHKIVPVRMPDAPTSVPEITDGFWRYRADVRLSLVLYHTERIDYSAIDADAGIDISVMNN